MDKLELLGLFPQELGEALADMKLPAYRVKQLFSWLHRGARFEEMTNISKPLRETLAQSINRRFGTRFAGKNLFMTAGAAAAITITFKALSEPGDEFITFAPFFP